MQKQPAAPSAKDASATVPCASAQPDKCACAAVARPADSKVSLPSLYCTEGSPPCTAVPSKARSGHTAKLSQPACLSSSPHGCSPQDLPAQVLIGLLAGQPRAKISPGRAQLCAFMAFARTDVSLLAGPARPSARGHQARRAPRGRQSAPSRPQAPVARAASQPAPSQRLQRRRMATLCLRHHALPQVGIQGWQTTVSGGFAR